MRTLTREVRIGQFMEEFSITSLFVYQDLNAGRPVGIVHLHDLLKAGVV